MTGEASGDFHPVVKWLAEKTGIDPADISASDRLRGTTEMDSLDFVELWMQFEEEWDVLIPDEVEAKLVTVQDLIDFVDKGSV